jgi:hypothetical protein
MGGCYYTLRLRTRVKLTAAIRRLLGLVPSKVPTVYIHLPTGETHNVPDPREYTEEQRAELIEKLKERLGFGTLH